MASDLQKYWADNQVSITVTFKKDEISQIIPCLNFFETQLKSVSLLPLGDSDHGYVQAPYTKINEKEYKEAIKGIKKVDLSFLQTHENGAEDKFCDGDSCTIL